MRLLVESPTVTYSVGVVKIERFILISDTYTL